MTLCSKSKTSTSTFPFPPATCMRCGGSALRSGKGETLGLVGESGCGKSMTALALMNLLPQTARRKAARLAFAGQDLMALKEREMADIRGDRMSMIFQEPMTSLNPSYTIGNQLMETMSPPPPGGPVRGPGAGRLPAGEGGNLGGQKPPGAIPPPALRRPAAAGDDRHGPHVRPGTDHRR